MTMTTTIEATRTLTERACKAELGRRNKPKATRGRTRSWLFDGMLNEHIHAVMDGKIVRVEFKSGRVEHVGLKVS